MSGDLGFTLIDPSAFSSSSFSVDAFLVSITKDVNAPTGRGSASFTAGKDALTATDQVQRVQRLLGVLARAEGEVSTLHQLYSAQVQELQAVVNEDEAQYRADVAGLERCVERIKAGVRDIDARASRVSQTATRIGDRLQTAEAMRVRCLEGVELLTHLQAFSVLPGEGDLSRLPRLFTDDATMAEAAAVSRRLLALTGDVAASGARGKTAAQEGPAAAAAGGQALRGGVGSIGHTVKMLTAYTSRLENRVVARFDAAAAAGDAAAQAECVRVMGQCGKERAIAQRWVSSRPMFVELDDAALEELLVATPLRRSTAGGVGEGGAASGAGAGGGGGGEGGGAPPLEGEQVRALSALYRRLRAAVESEVATAKAIFPRPELALELFMQRLFEQDAQLALEKLLGSRGSWAAGIDRSNPGAHRSKLQLLEAAYAETLALAADCERALRGVQVDVTSISEGLWPAFLGAYPAQELAWLDAAYRRDCADLDSPELSLQLVSRLIDRSREATARARRLSAPSQAARNARVLFHCPAGGAPSGGGAGAAAAAAAAEEGGGAHPGCLLEQLAQHIAGGVEYSLELCTAGGAGAIASAFRLGLGAVSRASSREAAQAFMNERIRRVLDAARLVSEITDRAQSHFELTVLPAVAPSVGDHSAAAAALLALLRAAEEGVTAVLRQAVDVFVAQFERVLYSEQRRSDFLPRDDELTFDRPTPACLLGTGMLAELGAAARGALEGANLGALLAEVGRRAHSVLVAHMARFTYSPAGALKWKKDVAEYAEALRGYGVAAVDEAMASLEQVVNVLVVAPESLMGLVNGSLRMAHRDALRIISLREDFKTARVDGRTLGQLFTGAVEGVMSLRV